MATLVSFTENETYHIPYHLMRSPVYYQDNILDNNEDQVISYCARNHLDLKAIPVQRWTGNKLNQNGFTDWLTELPNDIDTVIIGVSLQDSVAEEEYDIIKYAINKGIINIVVLYPKQWNVKYSIKKQKGNFIKLPKELELNLKQDILIQGIRYNSLFDAYKRLKYNIKQPYLRMLYLIINQIIEYPELEYLLINDNDLYLHPHLFWGVDNHWGANVYLKSIKNTLLYSPEYRIDLMRKIKKWQ